MMYSKKCKSIIKSSFCSLTAVLFVLSTLLININTVQAQPTQPGFMSCQLTSSLDINFGDINLVRPVTGTQAIQFKPTCESSYYDTSYNANFDRTSYIPSGAVCLGISSTNPSETSNQRYLYLEGDITSSHRLPFNFYFDTPATSLTIGDGVTSSGVITRGQGTAIFQQPAAGEKRPVPIFVNMIAGFDFTNVGLPVGEYKNIYNFTVWTGAGDGNLPNSICSGLFQAAPVSRQISVKVKVLPSCQFQILEHVNFGQHVRLTSNMTASGKLGVTCNHNASYEIQLNGGRNNDVNDRTMSLITNGAYNDSQKISYNLFLPNSTTIWGTTKGTNTYTATATDSSEHIIEVRATINPSSNPNPAVGIYRDNVTATIIY